MNGFVIVVLTSYVVTWIGFFNPKRHLLHVGIMSMNIGLDSCIPFYLFLTRDWKAHLIDSGDILSFGVWMHFGLAVSLYVLYIFQIQSGRTLLKNQTSPRETHAGQGKAIVLVRGLVILTGLLLIDTGDT